VSQYLRQELHGIFESVHKSQIPELFAWIKEIGGYFRRFKGGALAPWIHGVEGTPELDLEARATETFFEVGFCIHPRLLLVYRSRSIKISPLTTALNAAVQQPRSHCSTP
jgi:hypothetical protein